MVALSASRLVCSAIAVISLTTSPICLRGTRQLADPRVGLLGLGDGGFRDPVGFAHLPSDLLDRGRQFFGRARNRLDIAGSFLGGAGDLAGQVLGGFGGARQRARGRLQMVSGSRDVGDDRADRGLEAVGKADQFGAPGGPRRLVLRILRGGVAFGLGDRLQLELLDRAGHFAQFVLSPEAGQHDVEIAAGEFAHRPAHRDHGTGNAPAQHQRQEAAEQDAAGCEQGHEALGVLRDRNRALGHHLLLRPQGLFHGLAVLADFAGGIVHLDHEVVESPLHSSRTC